MTTDVVQHADVWMIEAGDGFCFALEALLCTGSEQNCFDEGHFWKQRRAFEKKWRDPDDVYIDVERGEEERKKLGLKATWAPQADRRTQERGEHRCDSHLPRILLRATRGSKIEVCRQMYCPKTNRVAVDSTEC